MCPPHLMFIIIVQELHNGVCKSAGMSSGGAKLAHGVLGLRWAKRLWSAGKETRDRVLERAVTEQAVLPSYRGTDF